MMRLGKEKESLNVVNDQKGNPTHANDLAYHILKSYRNRRIRNIPLYRKRGMYLV